MAVIDVVPGPAPLTLRSGGRRAAALACLVMAGASAALLVAPHQGRHAISGHIVAGPEAYRDVEWAPLPRDGWSVAASTQLATSGDGSALAAIDGDLGTSWVSDGRGPHEVVLDIAGIRPVVGLRNGPQLPDAAGLIERFEVAASADGVRWNTVATGTFADTGEAQSVMFGEVDARFLRLTAFGATASASELDVLVPAADIGAPVLETAQLSAVTAAAVDGTQGSWSPTIGLPMIPAASAAFADGKVLFWASRTGQDFGGGGQTVTALYDPATGVVTQRTVTETGHDMFCPGTARLVDGRLLVTGGVDARNASIYDPVTARWTAAPQMVQGRGYHSTTTLQDGSVLAVGGSWSGGVTEKGAETFIAGDSWRVLRNLSTATLVTDDVAGQYRADNHMWLIPVTKGRVLQAGPSKEMHWLSADGDGSVTPAGLRGDSDAMNGSAVVYDVDKILVLGGAPSYDNAGNLKTAYSIDASGATPVVTRVGDMAFARKFQSSVVLPDGSVVVMGGVSGGGVFTDQNSVLDTEMWSPQTGTFQRLAAMSIPRNYHSSAVLMNDGRILISGGGLCGSCSVNHPDAQIFTPPYLLNADGTPRPRPSIAQAPTSVSPGNVITVQTSGDVSSFSLVRYGAATHTIDNDQRRIPLPAVRTAANTYSVTIPNDSGAVVPGQWMLFALDAAGTPSVARTVSVTPSYPVAGLVAAYGFNEGSGSAVVDSSGQNNNGTATGTTWAPGRFGQALSFSGTGRVTIPDSNTLDAATGVTISAWVNPTSVATWSQVALKQNSTANDLIYGLYASEQTRGAGGWIGQGTSTRSASSPTKLPVNTWTHVAMTYDQTNVRYYQNGVLVATTPRSGALAASSGPLTIGSNPIWGEQFNGLIDEVRVYSTALSAADVAAVRDTPIAPAAPDTTPPTATFTAPAAGSTVSGAAVTLSANATDDVAVASVEFRAGTTVLATDTTAPYSATWNSTTVPNGAVTLTAVARDAAGNQTTATRAVTVSNAAPDTTPPTVTLSAPAAGATVSGSAVTVSADAADGVGVASVEFRAGTTVIGTDTTAPYSVSWNTTTVANGAVTLAAVARDVAGNQATATRSVTVANTAPPQPGGLVAAYGFNEATGTAVTDSSGSANNGTAVNATRTTTGRFGGALSFNGTSSIVNVPDADSLDATTAVTTMAWVNSTTNTGWRSVIMKENPARTDLAYALYGSTTTRGPGGWIVSGTAFSTRAAERTTRLTNGTWTHIAMTYDGTTIRLYVNGTQAATRATTGAIAATTGGLKIGGNSLWGEYFAGQIDEVRVYNRALSAAEVASVKDVPIG